MLQLSTMQFNCIDVSSASADLPLGLACIEALLCCSLTSASTPDAQHWAWRRLTAELMMEEIGRRPTTTDSAGAQNGSVVAPGQPRGLRLGCSNGPRPDHPRPGARCCRARRHAHRAAPQASADHSHCGPRHDRCTSSAHHLRLACCLAAADSQGTIMMGIILPIQVRTTGCSGSLPQIGHSCQ